MRMPASGMKAAPTFRPCCARRISVRGYDGNDRIVYGSGQIVPTASIPEVASGMMQNDRIAYIHVRSASNNCYQCRIDRA